MCLVAVQATAEPLEFDDSWKRQGFFRFWSNKYELSGSQLDVTSDGTVSLLYRPVPRFDWEAQNASWRWSVSETVIATDLQKKGDDDRNLAIYFVFVDRASAEKLSASSARRLLRNKNTRALAYVWGGDYLPGTVLSSPYGRGALMMVVKQPAGTGDFQETVSLTDDFERAFGRKPGLLVGVAITADSDDTNGKISAIIQDLQVF